MLTDVIGPVIVGPSSSHTAGMAKLGRAYRCLLGQEPIRVVFFLNSQLYSTYKGHGTDRALVGGVLNIRESDPKLKKSLEIAAQKGLDYEFRETEFDNTHPNTVKISGKSGSAMLSMTGSSIGGAAIKITAIEDFETNVTGDFPTLVIRNLDTPGALAQIISVISSSGINISNLILLRIDPVNKEAMCVIELDSEPDEELFKTIKSLSPVRSLSYLPRLEMTIW